LRKQASRWNQTTMETISNQKELEKVIREIRLLEFDMRSQQCKIEDSYVILNKLKSKKLRLKRLIRLEAKGNGNN